MTNAPFSSSDNTIKTSDDVDIQGYFKDLFYVLHLFRFESEPLYPAMKMNIDHTQQKSTLFLCFFGINAHTTDSEPLILRKH